MPSDSIIVTGPPASGRSVHRRLRLGSRAARMGAVCAALLLLLLSAGAAPPASPLARAISSVTARHGFDLVRWEVVALAQGIAGRVRGALVIRDWDHAARRRLVEEYFQAASEASRLHTELESNHTLGQSEQESGPFADLEARAVAAERRRKYLAEEAMAIVAGQIQEQVTVEGINTRLLDGQWHLALPPVDLTITPPVFFRFSELPLVLVVAPRDKIAVIDTVFLSPNLAISEMQQIERQIDQQDVSSMILPIGGFAAYPSMIPTNWSLRETFQVVAHEWTHHYLAMHPLGQRYFANYAMRSINETVADIVGKEIGAAVLARHYENSFPVAPASDSTAQPTATTFDFNRAMGEIRQAVEAKLSQGDVAGAEEHMADRKDWLAMKGHNLRKLNTAYLTFFGAYAGSGNSYEPKLRRLREQSKSLGDFLHRVEHISSERNFEALAVD